MFSVRSVAPAVLVLLLSMAACVAHGYKTKTLEIVHPWTFSTEPGTRSIAVCMIIKSLNQKGDRLREARTPIASKVELHKSVTGGAPTRAAPTLEIDGSRPLEMSISGDRLILHNVTKALWAYDSFPMTLIFERAGRIDIEVMVEEAPAVETR